MNGQVIRGKRVTAKHETGGSFLLLSCYSSVIGRVFLLVWSKVPKAETRHIKNAFKSETETLSLALRSALVPIFQL